MIFKLKNYIQNRFIEAMNIYILPYVDQTNPKCIWPNIKKGDLVILKSTTHNSKKKYGIVLSTPEPVVSKYHIVSDITSYRKRSIVRVLWNFNGTDFNNLEYCDNLQLVQRKNG